MKAGNVYTIDMVSTELDSYLRLLDPKGNQLEEDDDSGGNLNARIIFNCTKDGDYKVVTTSFGPDMKGAYSLTVKTTGGIQVPSTAHKQMLGKPAPEINGDFAINGKAIKLADLKGKVVLLYFWEVRSSASVALLPALPNGTWPTRKTVSPSSASPFTAPRSIKNLASTRRPARSPPRKRPTANPIKPC